MNGAYLLIIELQHDSVLPIGRLGILFFPKGYYLYVGSALNGLEQRIQRHLRKKKKLHWHIDYLLEHAQIQKVFYKENTIKEECSLAQKLEKKLESIPHFGCSDCTCNSHLFLGTYKELITNIEKLKMNSYLIF